MSLKFPYYHLSGGATRPDAISGLRSPFQQALSAMASMAPSSVQRELGLVSAYRSIAHQKELWDRSDKSGHSVARPGHSQHNFGNAADLEGFGLKGSGSVSQATRDWVHRNAGRFGLSFPMSWEPWHVQLGKVTRGPDLPPPPGTEPRPAVALPQGATAVASYTPPPPDQVASMTSPTSAPANSDSYGPLTVPASVSQTVAAADENKPAEDDLTKKDDKKKSLGGLLGELQKNAGVKNPLEMPNMMPQGGGGGGNQPSLAVLIQQYLASQARGGNVPAPGTPVQVPQQGGFGLG